MTKIDIVSGFLGAGKTTLIRKLIKDALAGTRVVLIENEFGEIGIDGGFLKEAGIEIREMNSGCICCSLVGDFGTALGEVMKTYAPERILIEPSGVGKLSEIMEAVHNAAEGHDMELNSAVAVVDASKCKLYLKNFGEFFADQIEYAGTIILTRTDKVSDKKIAECVEILREHNKKATIITTPIAELDGRQILDLSEKQIAYFANTYLNDPDDPQNGEGIHFRNVSKNDEHSSAYKYDTGGTPYMATSLLASGTGASFESGDPDDILGYHGLNSDRNLWNVATHYDIDTDKPVPESYARKPVWYSSDDDWSIPDEYRFVQNYSLRESIVMPDPAGSDKAGAYQYNEDAIRAIKQQLYDDHRAVCVSFCAVVGWDDNYPAANFLKTPVDEKGSVVNGAFLIKNSWGSELNEFPNNAYRHWGLREGLDGIPYDPEAKAFSDRATGYFWISYADRSLNDPEAFIFEEVPDDAVYYIEQLDYMYPTGFIGESFDGARSSNVLQAKTTSMLNAISVITGTPDTEVSYELYLLGDSYDGPEDGIKAGSGKASFSYGGYHKVTLEKPVALTKGQKFSIVVRMTEPDGTDYICHSADYDTGDNIYNVGIINPGESYMYYDGKWLDFSEPSTQDIIEAQYRSMDLILDNFSIKAYLEPIKYLQLAG